MRAWPVTILVIVVLFIVATARADNYGTTPAKYRISKQMVLNTFGNGWEGQMMVRCMDRESGGNPLAANYGDSNGGSFGLLQLNGAHRWRGESMRAFMARMWNPRTHLIAAKRLYDASKASAYTHHNGFEPWGGRC